MKRHKKKGVIFVSIVGLLVAICGMALVVLEETKGFQTNHIRNFLFGIMALCLAYSSWDRSRLAACLEIGAAVIFLRPQSCSCFNEARNFECSDLDPS